MRTNLRHILLGGIVAGTLDGLAASLQYYLATGRDPSRVFFYIASGAFGKSAYDSGAIMVIAGILFHFTFATGWSALFILAYPKLAFLRLNHVATIVFYGAIVWLGMNLVVIRLSHLSPPPFNWPSALQAVAILIVCISAPIVLIAKRMSPSTADPMTKT